MNKSGRVLVLMAGLPGAGKSALALALGHALRWPVVDKDTFKSALLESGVPEAQAAPLAYVLMFSAGEDLLRQGLSVILDSPLTHRATLDRAESLAAAPGVSLKVVFCQADTATRDRRMRERVSSLSQPASLSSPGGNPPVTFGHLPADALVLDTSHPIPDLLPAALAYVTG